MHSKKTVPREWSALPDWVKDELLEGPLLEEGYLECYGWYIQKLVDHQISMKPVWVLIQRHEDKFRGLPVKELLRLLNGAMNGPNPGERRNAGSRGVIAKQIAKDAKSLMKHVDWLTDGEKHPNYPFAMQEQMDRICAKHFARGVCKDLRRASKDIERELREGGVDAEIQRVVREFLFSLEIDVEAECRKLLLDVRPALKVLVDGSKHWAESHDWGYIEFVETVGLALSDWPDGDQAETTATLASAIYDREVNPEAVRKILLRARNTGLQKKSRTKP